MDNRQKQLFKNIVAEHIKTARAVASGFLVHKYQLEVCPATVRNDMLELEKLGLIEQPHTSAGRLPTEKGFKMFLKEFVDWQKNLSKDEEEAVRVIITDSDDGEAQVKVLAKILAEKAGLGVFVGFSPDSVYYTGLSYLFNQPEFRNYDIIYQLTEVIDHLDEVMVKIYRDIDEGETAVQIGRDNPFSQDCAAVMTKAKNILIGILGPMRMDYQHNVALINLVRRVV